MKELRVVLGRPDIQERYRKSGLKVLAEAPDVFEVRIAGEVPMYKDIIDQAGLKTKQ